jgi:hypothetical protein
MKYSIGWSETEIDLYKEFFEEFLENFKSFKRKIFLTNPELYEKVLDKLYELPLNRWKSKLRSVPEPITDQK